MKKDILTDIILKVAMAHHDDISKQDEDNACEASDAIKQILRERINTIETRFTISSKEFSCEPIILRKDMEQVIEEL